ncbi:hypothetical protein [Alkalimonas sp.]|uniref:hypothetical protein n=1 Tax=Alkalimonas sp. TaxID=1872453 RepID=UPI00263BE313|nr:hypothetical protein [Alkalimonas sp.]MCC5827277.1 hypothetical protein [Alkalimonas sp.]
MGDTFKNTGNMDVSKLLSERQQAMAQLQQLDVQIVTMLAAEASNSFQPLAQNTVKEAIEKNLGTMKVTELCMIADVAPGTYYNALTKLGTVKVQSLQRLLNTIGLELFIGQRNTEPMNYHGNQKDE